VTRLLTTFIANQFAALLVASCYITLASAASFDCNKASALTEKAICATSQLSALDDQMAQAFKDALATAGDRSALTASQRLWLRRDRNACQDDTVCLRQVYMKRIADLTSSLRLHGTAQPANERNGNLPSTSRAKCEDGRSYKILFMIEGATSAIDSGSPVVPAKAQFQWLGTNSVEVLQNMNGNRPWYANKRISWSQLHDHFYVSESSNGQTKNIVCHAVHEN